MGTTLTNPASARVDESLASNPVLPKLSIVGYAVYNACFESTISQNEYSGNLGLLRWDEAIGNMVYFFDAGIIILSVMWDLHYSIDREESMKKMEIDENTIQWR